MISLGFSVSLDEVLSYKQSVTENENANDFLRGNVAGLFTHWMADNINHKTLTLDGKGTLHAMGLCVDVTHSGNISSNKVLLIKQQKRKIVKAATEKKTFRIFDQKNLDYLQLFLRKCLIFRHHIFAF